MFHVLVNRKRKIKAIQVLQFICDKQPCQYIYLQSSSHLSPLNIGFSFNQRHLNCLYCCQCWQIYENEKKTHYLNEYIQKILIDFIHKQVMSLANVQQEIYEEILKTYSKKRRINFNLKGVIDKLKNGEGPLSILADFGDGLTSEQLNALEDAFEDEEFKLILSKQENIRLLVQSSQNKNFHLLKFLLKQTSKEEKEMLTTLQCYNRAKVQQQNAFNEILNFCKMSKAESKSTPNKNNSLFEQLLKPRKDLQNLFGGFKTANLDRLIILVLEQEMIYEQLQDLQDQMSAKEYKKLIQAINSHYFTKVKEDIRLIYLYKHEDEFTRQQRKQLEQIFAFCQIDTFNLINFILYGESQITILNRLQQKIQPQKLLQIKKLNESAEIKRIRQILKERRRTKQSFSYQSSSIKPITIQKPSQQNKQIPIMEDSLNKSGFEFYQQFSQSMIQFKKSLEGNNFFTYINRESSQKNEQKPNGTSKLVSDQWTEVRK